MSVRDTGIRGRFFDENPESRSRKPGENHKPAGSWIMDSGFPVAVNNPSILSKPPGNWVPGD
jgi:hypothetical protein